MSQDVPDWTAQIKANLVGSISQIAQGDVAGASLQTDQGSDTITASGVLAPFGSSALASFKAAAGATIAKVGSLGAFLTGTNTAVNPLFGQAPTAGNLLVAWITSGGSAITTATAGWVKAVDGQAFSLSADIWIKPNAAGGDAAPQFTDATSGAPMMAQLGEFSGVATVSPTDQTGTGSANSTFTATVAAGAADVAFGDLVLMATRWVLSQAATATFSDTMNNGAAAVNAGNSGAVSQVRHSNFVFAIIPAATVAQPLGVAPWAYDVDGTSQPTSGTASSIVLAATPGKTYTCHTLDFQLIDTGGAADRSLATLKDGATIRFNHFLGVDATTGHVDGWHETDLGYKGTVGNSMTASMTAIAATSNSTANIGAYLR